MANKDKEYLTIKQFVERNKGRWPDKERVLRLLFLESDKNGFEKAFFKVGNRVLIDWDGFWSIVDDHRKMQEEDKDRESEYLD